MKAFIRKSFYCLFLVLFSLGAFAQNAEENAGQDKKSEAEKTPTEVQEIEAETKKAQAITQNEQPEAEMADRLRADGKIYVVVAIILIILAGFIAYLIALDRKIKKLENLLNDKHSKSK
jgi:hypothetical protein